MLLGLDVLPKYCRRGLGRELGDQYLRREREKDRMYEKFGFIDYGMANST